MTLIVTAANAQKVVQVSDRRLTLNNGTIVDDQANKAVCVVCSDACFVVAYTGLAMIHEVRVDEWLTDYLASIRASGQSLKHNLEELQEHATITFSHLTGVPSKIKRTTFVAAGFWQQCPFVAQISNFQDRDGSVGAEALDIFNTTVRKANSSVKRRRQFLIWVHGTTNAVDGVVWKRLRRLRRDLRNEPDETVVDKIVTLVRAAARHRLGQAIGRSCMSTVVVPSGDFLCRYHPDHASPQLYGPNMVFPGMSSKGVQIWPGQGPPPWW